MLTKAQLHIITLMQQDNNISIIRHTNMRKGDSYELDGKKFNSSIFYKLLQEGLIYQTNRGWGNIVQRYALTEKGQQYKPN